jgi:hypothetical protein
MRSLREHANEIRDERFSFLPNIEIMGVAQLGAVLTAKEWIKSKDSLRRLQAANRSSTSDPAGTDRPDAKNQNCIGIVSKV